MIWYFMLIHDEFIHFLMSLGILPLEVLEQVGADQLIGGAHWVVVGEEFDQISMVQVPGD